MQAVESQQEKQAGWPVTCDSAVAKLAAQLPQSDKEELAAMKRGDLILLHHGFGTGIRNEFGLWGGNFALIKSCSGRRNAHPDDVSMIIIERLWDSLQ
tara:strand:- start:99 stop:392 length:294 start_codon:yes stop_codon:yes gene_type:complete